MKRLIRLLFILFCGVSYSQAHQSKLLADSQENVDSIVFSDFSFRGLPANTSEEEMRETLGKPDTIVVLNGTLAEARNYRHNEDSRRRMHKPVATFLYEPGIRYKLQATDTYLQAVDFSKDSLTAIHHPKIRLTSSTSIDDLKEVFPSAYASRNQGLSLHRNLLPESEIQGYQFITLMDTTSENSWQIELGFLDKKLSNFTAVKI